MDRILYKEADGDITCRSRDFDRVFPTLYAYEETGLTPEEIMKLTTGIRENEYIRVDDHLRDLLEAEKEGRLLVLPCKQGDTVWQLIHKCSGHDCPFNGGKGHYRCSTGHCDAHVVGIPFSIQWYNRLGQDLFVTIEEAKAALAKDTNVPDKKEE